MKLTRLVTMSIGILAFAGILWAATAQDKQEKPAKQEKPEKKETVFVSSDEAKFKEVIPGVSKVVLMGDPDKGPYRAFTKFEPGVNNALHTHTNDLTIVVLKGAYIYKPEKGEERRVSAGCYLSVLAGERHVSGGDPKEGALFYEESTGKFDIVFVDKK